MPKKIKKRHFLDYTILIPYLILCVVGLIMVYSSSAYLNTSSGLSSTKTFISQMVFWILSLIVIGLIYKMKISFLKNKQLIRIVTFVLTGLLVYVLIFGKTVNGAKGWIEIGSLFSIQPAELLKILVIWYLAETLSRRQDVIQTAFWETVKTPLILIGILTGIVAIMPDFGNASIIVLLVIVMLLISGTNYMYTVWVGGGIVLGSTLLIQLILLSENLFPKNYRYIYNRFAVFKNPFSDELGAGHQMVNGYYAMFNGGLFGLGLGNSIQKKGFLQEAQTDYIFAIVIEELGLIVALFILGLLLFLVARIILVGIRSKDPFNSLMSMGIGAMFLLQIFINLGGITGVIPLTGITFPFISQGGSSLLILSACIGFVLNISADEKRRKYLEEQ